MGKMPCTDHLHSKRCPQENFLYILRLAGHFPTQLGSESMCKKRWFRPPLLTTSSILCRQPRQVLGLFLNTGGGIHATVAFPSGDAPVASEALGSLDPRQCRSLWALGRWPADPSFGSNPGEAALRHTPFAGGRAGVGPPFRGPYAAARPCPSGRWAESLRADRR